MVQRPQTVVVHAARENSILGTAGLIFSILGWLTCGVLSLPGALLCFAGLLSSKAKTHAIIGLIVGFPATIFFFMMGLGMITAFLGIGAAAVSSVDQAASSSRRTMETNRNIQIPVNPLPETKSDESDTSAQPETKTEEPDTTDTSVQQSQASAAAELGDVKPTMPPASDNPTVTDDPAPEPTPEPVAEQQPEGKYRIWKSRDGKFKVDDAIELERWDNNKVIRVPLSKLCDEDNEYVEARRGKL